MTPENKYDIVSCLKSILEYIDELRTYIDEDDRPAYGYLNHMSNRATLLLDATAAISDAEPEPEPEIEEFEEN